MGLSFSRRSSNRSVELRSTNNPRIIKSKAKDQNESISSNDNEIESNNPLICRCFTINQRTKYSKKQLDNQLNADSQEKNDKHSKNKTSLSDANVHSNHANEL